MDPKPYKTENGPRHLYVQEKASEFWCVYDQVLVVRKIKKVRWQQEISRKIEGK